jgi:oligopeptidase A
MLEMPEAWIVHLILADMDDIKKFSKNQGALEADDLNHWDINFWSERLRESKFDINEVETGSAYSNTLLKMLDGQECRLDSKYSNLFSTFSTLVLGFPMKNDDLYSVFARDVCMCPFAHF